MLTYALKKTIFESIPTAYTVVGPNGSKTFTSVAKRYSNQFIDATPIPAIVIQFGASSSRVLEPLGQIRNVTTVTTDEFTKLVGVDEYTLTVPDADAILSVYGTVAGVKHTLIASSNYTFASNKITFIGTKPDDGTTFLVKYNHRLYRRFKGGEYSDLMTVNVYADDYRDEVTNYYFPGIVLAEQIAEQIFRYFEYTFSSYDMVTYPLQPIRDLDFMATVDQTQWRRRRQFDVTIKHAVSIEERVETIETVEHEEEVSP